MLIGPQGDDRIDARRAACRPVCRRERNRSEEHMSELQSLRHIVCRLLHEKKKLETLVIIMVANKYAFLQITRRRFLNEWEAFKKVISRRSIRRRITIPLTHSNLTILRRLK